ncbi:MAG: hypothetical protein LBK76_09070 [Verrucomicrobiales bacterium]|nr:hypothetical protein [Verrucomicrobiales bacterium]
MFTSMALTVWNQSLSAWPGADDPPDCPNLLPVAFTELPKTIPLTVKEGARETAKVSLSAAVKYCGAQCLQVERLTRDGNTRFQLATVPVQPGGRYYFSCRVKATAGNPAVSFDFRGVNGEIPDAVTTGADAAIRYHGHLLLWERQLADQPEAFNRLDMVFTAPAGATTLLVGIGYSWTLGTAWYDDFRLYALDEDAAAQ